MNHDYVFWLSIFGVTFAVAMLIFLSWKVGKLMKSDAEKHKGQSS